MRRLGIGLGAVTLALLAGCGEDVEPFSGDDACGAAPEVVAALIGTDRFETDPPREPLPISTDVPEYRCTVAVGPDTSDTVMTVEIDLDDQLGVDTFRQAISAGEPFDVGGGQANVQPKDDDPARFTGVWVCGSITGTVRGTSEDWTAESVRAVVEELADAAGCVTATA